MILPRKTRRKRIGVFQERLEEEDLESFQERSQETEIKNIKYRWKSLSSVFEVLCIFRNRVKYRYLKDYKSYNKTSIDYFVVSVLVLEVEHVEEFGISISKNFGISIYILMVWKIVELMDESGEFLRH